MFNGKMVCAIKDEKDIIKEPYVLEFLGISEDYKHSEQVNFVCRSTGYICQRRMSWKNRY
jgi:predicted nuclease of restriction endonuclease-like (RecB) superfamily